MFGCNYDLTAKKIFELRYNRVRHLKFANLEFYGHKSLNDQVCAFSISTLLNGESLEIFYQWIDILILPIFGFEINGKEHF